MNNVHRVAATDRWVADYKQLTFAPWFKTQQMLWSRINLMEGCYAPAMAKRDHGWCRKLLGLGHCNSIIALSRHVDSY